MGNSLKYINTGSKTLESNILWKYYQENNLNQISSTPVTTIIRPSNYTNKLNFDNFNEYGVNTLQGSSAFQKIQFFSKVQNQNLFIKPSLYNTQFVKLIDLYHKDSRTLNSKLYGGLRQHSFLSKESNKNSLNSYFDIKGVDKYELYLNNYYLDKDKSSLNSKLFKYNFQEVNTNIKSFLYSYSYNFKDIKSNNQILLPTERNVRSLTNNNQGSSNNTNFFFSKNTVLPLKHNPLPFIKNYNFDLSSDLLQSKEESAPNFFFETYWLTYWNYILNSKNLFLTNFDNNLFQFYLPYVTDYSEYDFKN
jgi:hypothetical protein